MRTIRILFLRDLRTFAYMPVSIGVILITMYYLSQLSNDMDIALIISISWAIFGKTVIFNSPPYGTSEFWMTRPISGVQLAVSKLAVAMLYGVLAPLLVLLVLHKFGAVPPVYLFSGKDILRIFSFMLLGMLLASLSKNEMEFLAVMLIFAVVSLLAMMIIFPALLHSGPLGSSAGKHISRSNNPLWWALVGLWNIGVIFIIIKQYTTRDRTTGIVATGGLMLLLICLAYIGLPVLMLLKS